MIPLINHDSSEGEQWGRNIIYPDIIPLHNVVPGYKLVYTPHEEFFDIPTSKTTEFSWWWVKIGYVKSLD